MQKLLTMLLASSLVPITIMSICGGLIGIIWLLLLGEWRLVLLGFFASFIFPFVYSLIVLLQVPIVLLIGFLLKKGWKILWMPISFVNIAITHSIDLVWVILAFGYMVDRSAGFNPLPYLLFGWEVAVAPFQWMGSKESSDSTGTFAAVYVTQVSYLILATLFLLDLLVFALPLISLLIISVAIYLVVLAAKTQRQETEDLASDLIIN